MLSSPYYQNGGYYRNEVITAQYTRPHTMDGYKPPQQPQPYVTILTQPQGKALRFRYRCEGRYPGALTGVGSTNENKTYPTIRVENYLGKFVVAVSCVTKDPPYRPHPHNIVSKEDCKKGVYSKKFDRTNMTAQFTTLGIQCVKKTEVKESLEQRQALKIDPFNTRFDHMNKLTDIDLNAVRLCFQVFIEEQPGTGKFERPLDPVVSDVIYDRKAMSDLLITKLSHTVVPMGGGFEMIVLCDKVSKEDVEIFFYQEDESANILWEEKADIQTVHKQVAICFRSPDCRKHFMSGNDPRSLASIKVHLRRSRINEVGEGRELFLTHVSCSGMNDGAGGAKRKRPAQEPNIQMQIELLPHQLRHPSVTVPRYVETLEPRYGNPSPKSEDSPAASPQWMMNSPRPMVMVESNAYGNGNEMGHILPDAANPHEIEETAEKFGSTLSFGLQPNLNNMQSDINYNNFNDEMQIPGPTATPVNVNGNIAEGHFSVPNLSATMFDSETSLGQLDLLDSDQLKFKQEEK